MDDRVTTHPTLPSPSEQARRLEDLGVLDLLGRTAEEARGAARALEESAADGGVLLVPHSAPDVPALMTRIRHADRPGFVVSDMTDVDAFAPTAPLPDGAWYGLVGPSRGDELRDVTPAEAEPRITEAGRTPLTILEGVLWLVQDPAMLTRNHCFMTIASRVRKPRGYDSRTPALWISNGTGRDGAENRDAPKLGWCWWNNRHTWLGIAHTAGRVAAV